MPDPVATMTALHTLAEAMPDYQPEVEDIVLHGQQMYRITVERLTPEQAAAAFERISEQEHAPWKS